MPTYGLGPKSARITRYASSRLIPWLAMQRIHGPREYWLLSKVTKTDWHKKSTTGTFQSSTRMCVERVFGMLKDRWRILLKKVNVRNFVSTCLVLRNMCIIFGNIFWRQEWMREATDEVHNWLAIPKVHGSSMQERLAVANLTLHSLADIDDNSRQTLEYIKQEDAMDFEIVMSTGGKLFKKLSARWNNIAKMHLDGKDEDMHCENSHWSRSLERTYIQSFSTNF